VQWQFFSGMAYYEPKLPCDPAQISRFRRVLGEAGVEQLLKTTIEAAVDMGAVTKNDVGADPILTHPADSILTRGWKPTA
jgi:IS5 family transposase